VSLWSLGLAMSVPLSPLTRTFKRYIIKIKQRRRIAT
jgi:hypothetical protein